MSDPVNHPAHYCLGGVEVIDAIEAWELPYHLGNVVKHAQRVQSILGEMGQECGFVCGDTPLLERARNLKQFRDGALKYLVNVNVLTTGFDAPNIDCVVLLRPTNSPGLYSQMVGRSFRLHPSKENALVLDYGDNILRHGPVDALEIDTPERGNGEAPAKECPECQAVIHAAYAVCPECGLEFPPRERERHDRQASTAGILTGEVTEIEYDVQHIRFAVHVKRGAPDDHPRTLRVDYDVRFYDYRSEWICFEHTGYARAKAEAWWQARTREPVPDTASQALAICDAGGIAHTLAITVRSVAGEKYDRIVNHELGPIPPLLSRGDARDDEIEMPDLPDDDVPF